ncbi:MULTISPECIES: hypothetical protein [unclassified Frankia]|uniref:hypothetical protein n=1 Tax=unclassified Frankia TaxID=2632575 RepID=UPI002AD487DE|nr:MULTISPECIES: hypothetical protein [unclassified Frankia]
MTTATPGTAADLPARTDKKITGSRRGICDGADEALRTVPRHLLLPGATLDEAYHPSRHESAFLRAPARNIRPRYR